MIFISSPYTSNSPLTRQYRVERVTEFTTRMLLQGLVAFSPIVYGEAIKRRSSEIGTDAKTWLFFNFDMLRRCEAMYVLCLEGWEQSEGVKLEINVCKTFGIPFVKYGEDFKLLSKEFAHVGVVEEF